MSQRSGGNGRCAVGCSPQRRGGRKEGATVTTEYAESTTGIEEGYVYILVFHLAKTAWFPNDRIAQASVGTTVGSEQKR